MQPVPNSQREVFGVNSPEWWDGIDFDKHPHRVTEGAHWPALGLELAKSVGIRIGHAYHSWPRLELLFQLAKALRSEIPRPHVAIQRCWDDQYFARAAFQDGSVQFDGADNAKPINGVGGAARILSWPAMHWVGEANE